jgi:hypothetical protein
MEAGQAEKQIPHRLNSLLKNSFWAHFDTKIGCK